MAAFLLESLVLRGVSVLRDVKAGELRRGFSYAVGGAPESQISMRHQPQWPKPNASANGPMPDVDNDGVAWATGTGRSLRAAGDLRLPPTCCAGRNDLSGSFRLPGRARPIATSQGRITARLAAFGSEATTRGAATAGSSTVIRLTAGSWSAKRQQAARIPPASLRGNGAR
jgi:hypothetical protein